MPQNLTSVKATLVQVMAWCHQAPSHYLSQSWPRSTLPYGITRPQRVKVNRPWYHQVTSAARWIMKVILSFETKSHQPVMIQLDNVRKCNHTIAIILRKFQHVKGQRVKHNNNMIMGLINNDKVPQEGVQRDVQSPMYKICNVAVPGLHWTIDLYYMMNLPSISRGSSLYI